MKTIFTFLICFVWSFARAQVDFAAPIMHAGIAVQTASVSVPAPYAWYKLDGNAIDAEGLNNGALDGSPTFVSGLNGHQAISLNGINQDVNVGPLSSNLFNSISFSASCWCYNTNLPPNTGSYFNQQQMLNLGQDNAFTLIADSDHAEWSFNTKGATGTYPAPLSGHDYINSSWHFVAGTFNGTTMTIMVDGQIVSLSSTTPSASYLNSGFIGQSGQQNRWWTGEIQDVRVWTNSLTTAQLNAVYQEGAQ